MRTSILAMFLCVTMLYGGEEKIVFEKHLSDGTIVTGIQKTEFIDGRNKKPDPKVAKAAEELGLTVSFYTGDAETVLLRVHEKGKEPCVLKKYIAKHLDGEVGYNEVGGVGQRLKEFKIFDVVHAGEQYLVMVVLPHAAYLDTINPDPGIAEEKRSKLIYLFGGEDERGGFLPFSNAQIISALDRTYIFFVSESGKHQLFEVANEESKRVWGKGKLYEPPREFFIEGIPEKNVNGPAKQK